MRHVFSRNRPAQETAGEIAMPIPSKHICEYNMGHRKKSIYEVRNLLPGSNLLSNYTAMSGQTE